MTDALIPRPTPGALAWAESLAEHAHANADAADSPGTRRAYESALRTFHKWTAAMARTQGISLDLPIQPEIVVGYVAHLSQAGRTPATVRLALWAIGRMHKRLNMPSPTEDSRVAIAMKGYTRRWLAAGNRQRRVAPLTVDHLRRMVALPPTHSANQEARDRAILLLAVALAARRSELIALRRDDLQLTPRGLRVYFARSKTDQMGEGAWLGVPSRDDALCAASAVRTWLGLACPAPQQPLFCRVTPHGRLLLDKPLGGNSIARIMQDFARRLGDPTLPPSSVAGHSPRATLVTLLMGQGVDVVAIAQHSRHRSLEVLRRYDRGDVGLGKRSILHRLYSGDDDG